MRDPARNIKLCNLGSSWIIGEYASHQQYLQWIMGHAVVEYYLRVLPVWNRWKAWHNYHKKQVAILTIHYGHPGTPDYGVGYFFA